MISVHFRIDFNTTLVQIVVGALFLSNKAMAWTQHFHNNVEMLRC